MNIAIITEEFPPHKGGGIAEWCMGIGENLVGYGHSVTILCKKKKKEFDYSIYDGKSYSFWPLKGHDWHRNRFWYSLYYLWRYLDRHHDAIIITSTWELAFAFSFLKNRYPGARLIVGVHGTEVTRNLSKRKVGSLCKTMNAAEWIIPVSRYTKGELKKKIGNAFDEKIVVVPNGVDIQRFAPCENTGRISERYGFPLSNHILLTLARIVERKGCDTVIEALPEIVRKYPDTTYIVAGSGERNYLKRLHEQTQRLKMENHVFFTGFVNDEDLPALYSYSTLNVMMSRDVMDDGDSEGFGITFLEANACECPVVGSTAGGIPDAVEEGVSGFLLPPQNPAALSATIISLFDNPEKLERTGKASRKRVEENFTWQSAAEKVQKLIQPDR
ncbi:MAG: glycosyltransferase [Chitinivibrionales bacterium]|nr:glycosyltransferase [Chitinivibrionales bacterium]